MVRAAGGRSHRSGNPPAERRSINASQLRARRVEAVELRVRGWTYDKIAEHQNLAAATVRLDIRTLLAEREAEAVPALRQLEADRLDAIVAYAAEIIRTRPGTEAGLKAADRILRAVALRANLFGLNAPVEVNLTEHSQLDVEIRALVQAQEALNQKTRAMIVDGEVAGELESGG